MVETLDEWYGPTWFTHYRFGTPAISVISFLRVFDAYRRLRAHVALAQPTVQGLAFVNFAEDTVERARTRVSSTCVQHVVVATSFPDRRNVTSGQTPPVVQGVPDWLLRRKEPNMSQGVSFIHRLAKGVPFFRR